MQAVELDPTFAKKVGQIVILGGAFAVNGNVNPAAEANVRFSCMTFHCLPLLFVFPFISYPNVSYSQGRKFKESP
jgi:hypothetical protein